MSNKYNDVPVRVTAEERQHPALRLLARACITIARLRVEQHAAEKPESEVQPPASAERDGLDG